MKKTLYKVLIICLVFLLSCKEQRDYVESDIHIIPKPAKIEIQKGVFKFSEKTTFVIANDIEKEIPNILINKFKLAAGWTLKTIKKTPNKNYVQFLVDDNLENEAYRLVVNPNNITISAKGQSGFIHGLESIRQLLPTYIESKKEVPNVSWEIPSIIINDKPRFEYRGLMLDVSRHFFEKDYVKEVIDGLSMLKMNVLHLHLVDDQGWRIEIKKYPKLTEVGAFRVNQEDIHWKNRAVNNSNDLADFGGFYTQEDIKEIVSYASSKGIEVIPEIEMPAHVMSAIASYPELSCLETPIGVPSGGVWPITEIYCAGKESTFEFLENVLLEVINLFPSKYIHVGGDEATKTNWATCIHCKKRMKNEGLHDVEQLQSYFIKRVEKFINSHNKKLIGWDEILEGGLAPDATVMSWRGVKGGLEAAKQGHDVIMTPGSHCYFNHYQGPQNNEPPAWGGFTPLNKVYSFDPVVKGMTQEQASNVLGGQANLWSEYIQTQEQSEYMIFPRLSALSEAVWSPKKLRDWDDFTIRIMSMFERYEHLGINYAKSVYGVTTDAQINMEDKVVEIILKNELPDSDIRYSLDGSDLSNTSKKYTAPIKISHTTNIKASLFKNNKPIGKELNKFISFHKGVGKNIIYNEIYSEKYKGKGISTLVNTLRGTKNFHDGQWQGWLGKDMETIIDLEKETPINQVIVGSMENQGSGIYYPIKIEVFVSNDGKHYKTAGHINRAYKQNSFSELKNFEVNIMDQKARYIKVIASNLKQSPKGGGSWLFIDEILIH